MVFSSSNAVYRGIKKINNILSIKKSNIEILSSYILILLPSNMPLNQVTNRHRQNLCFGTTRPPSAYLALILINFINQRLQ